MDAETVDIPERADAHGVARSPTCISFAVRHAQDTEGEDPFQVALTVRRGRAQAPTIEHLIQVPSRAVTVGDPEHEERIDIDATACLVGVELEEPWHSAQVTIWLEPAP
jgi:hypothetical protein